MKFAALLAAPLLAGCTEPQAQPTEVFPSICMDEVARENIRAMSIEAVDAAFKGHVQNLFGNWMKDHKGQPARAQNGMRLGIAAYLRAKDDAQKWNPPPC